MRGVHTTLESRERRNIGSSPHARGPLFLHHFASVLSGIIPACAGSTSERKSKKLVRRDHPRMRGVHQEWTMVTKR